jgi:hypothetical protein
MMAIVKDMDDPCAGYYAHVNEEKNRNQRVKVPLGIGAGNGAEDCCAGCADGAGWAGCAAD